jgi:GT2 family glycosyltransferase
VKLSIVIICWNDLKVILNCLASIYAQTHNLDFEIIVSDNGSADASRDEIRKHFPKVKIVENNANLGFARGNNAGIRVAQGQYILILNPDTLILDRALEKLIAFADAHPEAGAFGCRVLNPDGSFQNPARPVPTLLGYAIAAMNLRWLGHIFKTCESDVYPGWQGQTEREIGFQSGCCVLFRGDLLKNLNGFDDRFFYHFEESDLCCRVWKSGSKILYYPKAEITHLGGQSVGRFPVRFALETHRSAYRFFHKHYGPKGLRCIRRIHLLHYSIRYAAYSLTRLFKPSETLNNRLQMYRVVLRWNWQLDPLHFIQTGAEPQVGYEPLAPAPKIA